MTMTTRCSLFVLFYFVLRWLLKINIHERHEKVSTIIEEQAIVVYGALPSQGMSWKVYSKFAYGHIKTHPYSPCENKDGFFLANFFCSNTWTFLIKFFSHNKILPWFLIHNTFILFYLGLWFNVMPSYCWHYGGWPRCNSPLCMLIYYNTFIFFTIVVASLSEISHYVHCFSVIPSSCSVCGG
jgi:hypothetical protein